MDFKADPSLDAFRLEVREFLRVALPEDLAHKLRTMASARADLVRWQKILNARGWGAPGWAKEHGGTGWTPSQRLIFDEECTLAGTPTQDVFGQNLLGPVLNHFGSRRQIETHVPRILGGDSLWCQGFSEPGSGSDLASLRTAAVLSGDHYVVDGQKIWTSYAHRADWIFLLVRTNVEVRRQAGISFLLVDMKSPGITVRPIHSIDGCHHLNEVFFDNVRVPAANLVGAEGDGWKITKFLLNNEHAGAAELPHLQGYLHRLSELGRELFVDSHRLIDSPAFRLRWVRLEAEVAAIGMMTARVGAMEQENDTSPAAHALGSILKLRSTELQQKLSAFLVEALGDYGAIAYHSPQDDGIAVDLPLQGLARGIATDMFFRRASTIYGGSSEIQRGIIGKTLFQF